MIEGGPSPHMRGSDEHGSESVFVDGAIPAHAGGSSGADPELNHPWVHPRVSGVQKIV